MWSCLGVYNPEKRSVLDSEQFVVIEILFVQAALLRRESVGAVSSWATAAVKLYL